MRWSVAVVVSVVLVVAGCSSDTSDAAGTLDEYVAAYNADDLEGVVSLFADDSVMVMHPVNAFAVGADEIRRAFSEDVGQGLSVTISIVSVEDFAADEASVAEAYSVVRWDQTWRTVVNGEEVCRSGPNLAVISEGTIYRLNWTGLDCR